MSETTTKSRVLDMTNGSIPRLLLAFALPIFIDQRSFPSCQPLVRKRKDG